MKTLWLMLYLGTLVHGLTLFGFNTKRPACLVLLLPFLLLPFVIRLQKRTPRAFGPLPLRIAGSLALLCAILFLRMTLHTYWSTERMAPALAMAGLGLGSLWVAVGSNAHDDDAHEDSVAWILAGLFTLSGFVDPLLPILGVGISALAASLEKLPAFSKPSAPDTCCLASFSTAFLLGLSFPKPWWDFGLAPAWALPSTCFFLGAALSLLPYGSRLKARLPLWALHTGMGLLAILYWPTLASPWGLCLGLISGLAWARIPRPLPFQRLAWGLLSGLLLSFLLHANAWTPGLRHLIWLGN